MRILHVVPSYLPAWRYGGPIWSVHGLAKALVRKGHEVHVFTTDRDGPRRLDVPTAQPVPVDGVSVWYFPCRHLKRLFWAPQMKRALRRAVPDFDVVHLHSVYLWPTAVAAATARRNGVPYVLAPRGMLVDELIERKSAWVKRAWIALVERRNLEGAATLHFTSRLEVEEAQKLRLVSGNAVVVPNGIDADEVHAEARAENDEAGDATTLLYIGRLSWKKGLDRLITALGAVPRARLIVAGNDDENCRPRLEALASERGVRERVEFLDAVYGAEKAGLFRRASVFVLPSYNENFGNVVIEAMAAGLPVVVTPEVGAAEAVVTANAGVVADGDPPKLAAAIGKLLADPAALRNMGENGRRAVAAHYTWDAVAGRMVDVYRAIARERDVLVPAAGR